MNIIIIPDYPKMTGRHRSIANGLVERGHNVHYIMWEMPYNISLIKLFKHIFTSIFPKQYAFDKFTVHKISRLPFFWPHINGWLFAIQLRRLYKRIGADFVFAESYTNETNVPADLPLVYDLADDYAAPAEVYGSPLYKLAFRLLDMRGITAKQCEQAMLVTAVSGTLINYADAHSTNVLPLPNGVDKQTIEAVLGDPSTYPTNPYSLVYASVFGRWSRVVETMEAVIALREEYPSLELTLAGGGVEEATIKAFIKDHGAADYIHYTGMIYDRKTWFSTINRSTIGLNISDKNKWRDAAHPIKVLEYSALGKKVVSTDLHEVVRLNLPNVSTFSDKPGNTLIPVLRQAIEEQVNGTVSFDAISLDTLATYDWDKIVERLLSHTMAALKQRDAS